ncbi:hypothetical protein MKX01_022935 [Papaver californicum]|nr:hypothetical protein MKX01_022935 [Papaver californicum]
MWSDPKSSLIHHINHRPDDSRAFEERVSFLSGQQVGRVENSPFQRHPDAAKVTDINKGPVLFIAKPTPSVAGIKRKLKKIQKDWTCDLCQVKVTCEQGLNDHIKGKKHRVKEAAGHDNPEAEAKETICGPKPNEENKVLKVKKKGEASCQDAQKTDNSKKKFKYWCECCQIECHSPAVMADHEGGKKHQTRLQLREGEDVQAAIVSTTSENANDEKSVKDSAGKEEIKDASEGTMGNVIEKTDGEQAQEQEEKQCKNEEEEQCKNANDEKTFEYPAGKEAIKEASGKLMDNVIGEIDGEEAPEEEEKQCLDTD